jgi:hypothetical protein
MPIDYTVLHDLSLSDPRGYGFRALISVAHGGTLQPPGTTQYQDVTDLWNAVRDGSNPGQTPTGDGGQANGIIMIRRDDVSPNEILEVLDIRDFETTAGSPFDSAYFNAVMKLDQIRLANPDGTNTRILGNLRRMLQNADAQGSEARLLLVANRVGSYAEQKFGPGTHLTAQDLVTALGVS